MQALAASCQELHERTGNPPLHEVHWHCLKKLVQQRFTQCHENLSSLETPSASI